MSGLWVALLTHRHTPLKVLTGGPSEALTYRIAAPKASPIIRSERRSISAAALVLLIEGRNDEKLEPLGRQ